MQCSHLGGESNMFRKQLETLRPYIPGKSIEKVKEEYQLTSVNKLASNENPLGPSPKAIEAMKEAVETVHIYPDPSVSKLSKVIRDKYQINEDEIIFGNGGEELIKLVAQTFINPEDEAIMSKPTFGLYHSSVTHMGGVGIEVPSKIGFGHDLDVFLENVNEKTKLVYICNPNNPTGNVIKRDTLMTFVNKLPKEVVLFLDEAYFDFASVDPEYPNGLDILRERPNTIILRTFSKISGIAGMRVAYLMTSPEIVTQIKKVKGVFNVNSVGQAGAYAAFLDTVHTENTIALNQKSIEALTEFCDDNNLAYIPTGSNFLFMETAFDSFEVFEALQKQGVIIRPGGLWGHHQWIRVSSGTMAQTENFIEVMTGIMSNK